MEYIDCTKFNVNENIKRWKWYKYKNIKKYNKIG